MSDAANRVYEMALKFRSSSSPHAQNQFVELMKAASAIAASVAPYQSGRLPATKHIPADLSKLTDEELAELKRLTKKATREEGSDQN